MNEYPDTIKLLLLGSKGVGKTNLITSFVSGYFAGDETDFGLSTEWYNLISIDQGSVQAEINEISESFVEVRSIFRSYHGFLLCFALDDLNSFLELSGIYNLLLMIKNPDKPPVIIIGTKNDLEESKIIVQKEEIEEFISEINCEYFETSAVTAFNINKAFQCIAQKTVNYLISRSHNQTKVDQKQKGKDRVKNDKNEVCLI